MDRVSQVLTDKARELLDSGWIVRSIGTAVTDTPLGLVDGDVVIVIRRPRADEPGPATPTARLALDTLGRLGDVFAEPDPRD